MKRVPRTAALLAGLVACIEAGVPTTSPAKTLAAVDASRLCRKVLGRTHRELVRLGLHELDACPRARARGRTGRDCLQLRPQTSGTAYWRWAHRVEAIVDARCGSDDVARNPFPLVEASDKTLRHDPGASLPDVATLLDASAAALGGGTPDGDARCLAGVAVARSRLVRSVMRDAIRCQRALDQSATTFGRLDPSCLVEARAAAVRAAAGVIAGACPGLDGVAAGTCTPLPECVVTSATETGRRLAAVAFGQCGNGVVDAGEECDDGNDDATDDCVLCRAPQCGNGRVEPGEECDDGNLIDRDTCTQCRNPVCGDGIIDVGAEECDDGNSIDGDGCSGCTSDPVSCGANGIVARVTFAYDPATFGDIAGIKLRLRYPAATSIPGSLVGPSITQRVTSLLQGVTPASYGVADLDCDAPSGNGSCAGDGVDDTLQTLIAFAGSRLPPGPFQDVRFDCAAGETLKADQFACAAVEVSDPGGNAKSADDIARETRCSIGLSTAP